MKILLYRTSAGRSPIEKFIEGLSKPDQGKFHDVFDGVTTHGLTFESVEFRHLNGKLWEIKFRAKDGGYRIVYVLVEHEVMVWLHAFKKDSQKTPPEDLELAKKRLKEVLP